MEIRNTGRSCVRAKNVRETIGSLKKNKNKKFFLSTKDYKTFTFSIIQLNFLFDMFVNHLHHKQILVDQDTK